MLSGGTKRENEKGYEKRVLTKGGMTKWKGNLWRETMRVQWSFNWHDRAVWWQNESESLRMKTAKLHCESARVIVKKPYTLINDDFKKCC